MRIMRDDNGLPVTSGLSSDGKILPLSLCPEGCVKVAVDRTRIPFFRLLDSMGNGTGVTKILGNYITPYRIKFIPNKLCVIQQFGMVLEDNGVLNWARYGSDIRFTGSQGVLFSLDSGQFLPDATISTPIQTNSDWIKRGFNVEVYPEAKCLKTYLSFDFMGGLHLDPQKANSLTILCLGKFSALTDHMFFVQGFWQN